MKTAVIAVNIILALAVLISIWVIFGDLKLAIFFTIATMATSHLINWIERKKRP